MSKPREVVIKQFSFVCRQRMKNVQNFMNLLDDQEETKRFCTEVQTERKESAIRIQNNYWLAHTSDPLHYGFTE